MKEKGGEVCINRFSVKPSSMTHCDAVGPAPRQMPRPYLCPPERGKGPASAGRGFCQSKETYTHPPTKAPRRITIRISLHAPIRGRPGRDILLCLYVVISIHAPIRGRLVSLSLVSISRLFQSTPPYGGDYQTGQLEFLKFFHLFPRKAVSRFSNSRFQMLVLSVRFPLALTGLWKLPDCRSV